MPVRLAYLSRVGLGCLCTVAALAPIAAYAPAAVAVSTTAPNTASGGAAGGSAAGGSAFNELATGGRETAPSTARKTTTAPREPPRESPASTATSNSNTGSVLVLGLLAAGALIGGIAFMILRDARRVAPIPDGQVTAAGRPARDIAVIMRKRRAKAKAARRQRKRNR